MGSSQAKPIGESVPIQNLTDLQPSELGAMDELDKICGFHPFSLRNHEKEFQNFVKSKFSKDLDSLLQQAISKDDKEAFSSLLNMSSLITEIDWWSRPKDQKLKLGYAEVSMNKILSYICKNKALGCATALLEPGFVVNLNVKIPWDTRLGSFGFPKETTPLYWAAAELSSDFFKLFQSHGAQVDEPLLQLAIGELRNKLNWKMGDSVSQLYRDLLLRRNAKDLDRIKLLTNDTEVVERAFQYFLRDRSIDSVAILLMVAQKKIQSPKCRQYFEELNQNGTSGDENDGLASLQSLIKFFQDADPAYKYVQAQPWGSSVPLLENCAEYVRMIRNKADFHLESELFGSTGSSPLFETRDNASGKPTKGTPTYQSERTSQRTSPFTGKDYRHFSTSVASIQPFYVIQKSPFSTLGSGNAKNLNKSLRIAEKGFVPHILMCRRLASLALRPNRKCLRI